MVSPDNYTARFGPLTGNFLSDIVIHTVWSTSVGAMVMNKSRVIVNTLAALVITFGLALSLGATESKSGTRAFCCADNGTCCMDCSSCTADADSCACIKEKPSL